MAAYRETPHGEFEIYGDPAKAWRELALAVAFAAAGGLALLYAVIGWLLLAVGLGLGIFALRDLRDATSRRPLLVLGPEAVRHASSGSPTSWEDIERIELFDWGFGGSSSRHAAFHLHAAHPSAPHGFTVDLDRLAPTEEEVVGMLRRHWGGPIDGYRGTLPARDAPIRRPPRWHRFLRWARAPALGVALAVGAVLLVLWADP